MFRTEPSPAPRLGFGGAGIGNHLVALSDDAAQALLREAWDVGVRLFDTAPHYGLGLSERRMGEFFAGLPRDEFRISTKVGRSLVPQDNPDGRMDDEDFLVPADLRREWDFTADGIRAGVEGSLARLGVDHIDALYLHDPERWDLAAALDSGLPALQQLKDEGLVGTVGVASMSVDALLAAARTGAVDELMAAGRYTLIDRSAGEELLPWCADHGVAVVAAAVFNGGLLAATPTEASTFDYVAVQQPVLRQAIRLDEICREAGVELAAAALQFPLRHAAVTDIVVGAVEPGQTRRNAALLAAEIPEQVWQALENAAEVPS